MPWAKGASKRREKLEEATTAVPLLKDTWVKAKLILTHMAGLASLVSTMNSESAQQRASIERLTVEVRALAGEVRTAREEADDRHTAAQARRRERTMAP